MSNSNIAGMLDLSRVVTVTACKLLLSEPKIQPAAHEMQTHASNVIGRPAVDGQQQVCNVNSCFKKHSLQ